MVTVEAKEPTPIARVGVEKTGRRSLISPERLQRLTIESARIRLLNEVRTFVCADCLGFLRMLPVKEVGEGGLTCPECGLKRIGVLDRPESEVQQLLNKQSKGLTTKDKEALDYIGKTADLMAKYGMLSTLVLAGKNIRLSEAEEALSKAERVDDKLFEVIVEAEKKALARRLW